MFFKIKKTHKVIETKLSVIKRHISTFVIVSDNIVFCGDKVARKFKLTENLNLKMSHTIDDLILPQSMITSELEEEKPEVTIAEKKKEVFKSRRELEEEEREKMQ